ncbi:MAG: hypothetical protein WBP41_06145 [Saprospiraceae bacterium]
MKKPLNPVGTEGLLIFIRNNTLLFNPEVVHNNNKRSRSDYLIFSSLKTNIW